jgi:hypothetical protein
MSIFKVLHRTAKGWDVASSQSFQTEKEALVYANNFVGLPHHIVHKSQLGETINYLNRISRGGINAFRKEREQKSV